MKHNVKETGSRIVKERDNEIENLKAELLQIREENHKTQEKFANVE
jgi:hypothetical protein